MILDPYETRYGKVIKDESSFKLIKDYVIDATHNSHHSLSYEFYDIKSTVKPYFILGKNSIEEELKLFDHPIVFTFGDHTLVVSDLRKFFNKSIKGSDPITIYSSGSSKNYISNRTLTDIEVHRNLITCDFLNDKIYDYKNSFITIGISFAVMISDVLRGVLGLNNPSEIMMIRLASYFYYSMLLRSIDQNEDIELVRRGVISRANHINFGLPITSDVKSNYLNMLTYTDDLSSLCDNINTLLSVISSGHMEVTGKLLIGLLSGHFKGLNGSSQILVSLEHVPTFISILYSTFTDKGLKTTKLFNILEKNKTNLQAKNLVDNVSIILNKKVNF